MSLLPPVYLNAVVSIEKRESEDEFRAIATGFLVGFKSPEQPEDENKTSYHIFLVTNRHVFRDKQEVWLRFNKGDSSKRYRVELKDQEGNETWSVHPKPKIDVAVISIRAKQLQDDKIEFSFFDEDRMAGFEKIKELGIAQGDGIFVLGFPMGIAGEARNYVIARGGIIARLDQEIIETNNAYLIDALIFPGNSGGPVILRPSIASIEGTQAVKKAYLIGIVKGYVPYREIAYSLQHDPPEPRINFTENSGLAYVVPLDYLYEIVQPLMPKRREDKEKDVTVQEGKSDEIPNIKK